MRDEWDFDTQSSQDDLDAWEDDMSGSDADADFDLWDEPASQADLGLDLEFDTWDEDDLQSAAPRPEAERWREAFISPEPGLRYDEPELLPEDELALNEPRRRGFMGRLLHRGARREDDLDLSEFMSEDDEPDELDSDEYSLDSILRGYHYAQGQAAPPAPHRPAPAALPVAVAAPEPEAEAGPAPAETPRAEATAGPQPVPEAPAAEASVPKEPAPDKAAQEDPAVPESAAAPAPANETIADRSRRVVRESFRQRLSNFTPEAEVSPAEPEVNTEPESVEEAPVPVETQEAPAPAGREERSLPQRLLDELEEAEKNAPPPAPAVVAPPEPPPKPKPKVTIGEDGIITLEYTTEPAPAPVPPLREDGHADEAAETTVEEADAPVSEASVPEDDASGRSEAPAPEAAVEDESDDAPEAATEAEPDDTPFEEGPEDEDTFYEPAHGSRREPAAAASAAPEDMTFAERVFAPVVHFFATKIVRRQIQTAEAESWPEPNELNQAPELPLKKAAKFYARLATPLRLRGRIALALCVILAWISLQLPMAGMLGKSLPQQAGVCLVLTLAVMIAALDVVSTGLRQLFDLHPGAEALATTAAFLSCVDAALVMFGVSDVLPFCAVGAVSLTSALWGQRLTCSALIRTYRTAAESKAPSVLTSEAAPGKNDKMVKSLLRSPRNSTEGLVRRSEEQDFCQYTYAAASPILLIAALLLSFFACLGCGWSYFLHTLSALVSVSASFAAFFSFALPYSLASRRLRASGAALAGYAGCADIAKVHRIVIGDEDLFPPGTMKFSEINILEGSPVDKVISYTTALMTRSRSGVSALFTELAARREAGEAEVEQYKCHEGGGLSGMIDGSQVLVGSAGFMNLMGIRLPRNLRSRNAICTAIDGDLMGVFVVDYTPTTSVQEALMTLIRGRTQAIFAIRDFNISPAMVTRLFRIPGDNLNFPSFRDRYRIAAAAARKGSPINAVITRTGMLPLAEAAEAGRKLHATCRTNTLISLAGAIVGMLIMFLLCRAGSFDTATAGNVLTFMLLWALPEIILSIGQNR